MQNVKHTIEGDELVLRINLKHDTGIVTKNGNHVVATTDGYRFEKFSELPNYNFNIVLTKKGA